ncbi:MAG: transmembrane anchor protein [Elusimicrobiales bacterium]
MPDISELPSKAKLIKSTILAAAAAGFILATIVMPAEYGIDPIGIGRLTGLKKMGEIKVSLAKEAAAAEQAAKLALAEQSEIPPVKVAMVAAPAKAKRGAKPKIRTDRMKVTLAPNEGVEVKLFMEKGRKVKYSWATNGGRANYDIHGDSEELGISYQGYSKGSEQKSEGVLKASFDGNHGWFWRNRTDTTITVTLKVRGEHTGIKNVKKG